MTVKMWPDLPEFTLLLLLMEITSVDCSTMETAKMRTQPHKTKELEKKNEYLQACSTMMCSSIQLEQVSDSFI